MVICIRALDIVIAQYMFPHQTIGRINSRKPPVRNVVNKTDSHRDCLKRIKGCASPIAKLNAFVKGAHLFATHPMLINSHIGE